MWRYVTGGAAALLLVAAGWLLFSGKAQPDRATIAAPRASETSPVEQAAIGKSLPEAPERSREQKRFDRYDKDRNGRITREEYLASRRKAFAKLDANSDGRLAFDEWAIKTSERFAAADRDRSNEMDAAEFATTAPKRRAKPACRCSGSAAAADD